MFLIETALKAYFEKCQLIFKQHHLKMTKVVTFPGTSTDPINDRRLFEEAIKGAEDTEEFEAFVIALQAGPLSYEIERFHTSGIRLHIAPKRERQ